MTASSGRAAVDRANNYTSYSSGMCLQWVRGPCWDIGSYYGSAIDAWDGAKYKHKGDRTPPLGAPTFYRGGQYGHIVIFRQDDMRSTDCTSTGRVSAAAISWVENNWGFTYLGWTEDLNGVRLPLGNEEDDMPNYRDWSQADKDALARDVADAVWQRQMESVTNPAGDEVEKKAGPLLRETWEKTSKILAGEA